MARKSPQKGAIAPLACKHLSLDDCKKHPSCAWSPKKTQCIKKRLGKSPKITRKSPKRVAAGKRAIETNPWHLFRQEHPGLSMEEQGALYRAQKTKKAKQAGGTL